MQWESASWLLKMAIGPKFAVRFTRIFKIYFYCFFSFGLRLRHQAGPDHPQIASGALYSRNIRQSLYYNWVSQARPTSACKAISVFIIYDKTKDIAAYIQTVARPTHIQANRAQNLGQTCL